MPAPEDKKINVDEDVQQELMSNAEKQRKLRDALIQGMTNERQTNAAMDKLVSREKRDVKADKYWGDVGEWVNKHVATGVGFEAYHDYTSSMMSLCAGLSLLNKAMAYDNLGERGMKFVWNHTLGATDIGQSLEALPQLPGQLYDMAEDKVLRGIGVRNSPVLVYSVDMDEQGKITTNVTKNGVPLSPTEQQLFDTGLVAWLKIRENKHHDCSFDSATQILKDGDGNVMTLEKFKTLMINDEHGLTAFFEDRMDVAITQSPRP